MKLFAYRFNFAAPIDILVNLLYDARLWRLLRPVSCVYVQHSINVQLNTKYIASFTDFANKVVIIIISPYD